ncbi:MAG: rod shape-determining protein MreD [Candidatus Obscuribacterales bacterium]|nr:rod shape-determining protein MreD [Candidatus Obscuribacterales bacterium]
MSIVSIRTKRRIGAITMAVIIVAGAWVLQLGVISRLFVTGVQCSLPLTLIIVWGVTFGSPIIAPSKDELRLSTVNAVVLRQALSGSISGALLGAAFAALYSSVLPAYPVAYPLVGWIAGYFCLRNFNKALILCIPLVLILTFLAEAITAVELLALGRPNVFESFVDMAMTEAVLNSLIAPFVFLPMRGWYEFARYMNMMESR